MSFLRCTNTPATRTTVTSLQLRKRTRIPPILHDTNIMGAAYTLLKKKLTQKKKKNYGKDGLVIGT